MPNRLAREKSPYLLQHADNPVDWYPWGTEALDLARREDKPVLVSIGYSACHWCHVMAHESFEDPTIAALMNDRFVNIKVDREERPDVDSIYMEAVQAITGQGGWPLNAFLTPDGSPFFGGTYYPPAPRHGLPSWSQVLEGVAEAYRDRRPEVAHNAERLTEYVRQAQQRSPVTGELSPSLLRKACGTLLDQADWQHGGLGGAPKFPQPLSLEFALRMDRRFGAVEALNFSLLTLRKMAAGGIHDQLGGGFHRYAVDNVWLVPHFEKMLYDNALLARVYLQAFQITQDADFRRVAEDTLTYLVRDLLAPEGAFYSAEDADSEGVEGKFYVWDSAEIEAVAGADLARVAAARFGVTAEGNFEGKTILTQARTLEEVAALTGSTREETTNLVDLVRSKLLAARGGRVRPASDTKILAGWNALAIRALAEGGRILKRPDYLSVAERACAFIMTNLRPNGRLVRSYREGPSSVPAFLEDYAYLVEALISLAETSHTMAYLHQAEEIAAEMLAIFWDDEQHTFFDAPLDQHLVVRPRSLHDNPIPSGSSAATFGLLRLEALTGRAQYGHHAVAGFHAVQDLLPRAPQAFAYLLSALDFYLGPSAQIAIVARPGTAPDELVEAVHALYLPNKVLAVGHGDYPQLLAGRDEIGGKPSAYVCERFACQLPVTDPAALLGQLAALVL